MTSILIEVKFHTICNLNKRYTDVILNLQYNKKPIQ